MQIWLSVDPLAEKYPNASPYNYCLNNPINMVDPDGRSPFDHWRLNKQGKLELAKKTNDNFNVFFDENGNKLFQTNQQSTEMTNSTWSGKPEEYQNKFKSVFIQIANEPAVYNQMENRAKETGFDSKFVTISQMKEIGQKYKSLGPAMGFLDFAKEIPKWGAGYVYAGAASTFGYLFQSTKSIYTGATGTGLVKDAKSLFHQALENSKTFISDFKEQLNNGMSTLSKGQWGNSSEQKTN